MQSRIPRRKFLKTAGKASLGFALAPSLAAYANPSFDLLLKGGTILDGTGGPAWKGDIGVSGDTIAAIGPIAGEQAKDVIDVSALYVSPGFIDIHTHSDWSIAAYPKADSRVRQGVTTEITGNCGSSAAPLSGKDVEESRKELADEYGYDPNWTSVASYFEILEKKKISLNQALLIGQGTIRSSIIGLDDRRATPEEMNAILRVVEEGMEEGAIGLSTGLEYTPGRYTPTEEIVEMVRIVARRGGLYASHIRNEEKLLLEAINEAVDIGRQTGARVQISHLKAAGRINWGMQRGAIHLIESARSEEGVEVLADAYPYTAYSTGLTVLLESWVLDGGTPALMRRLKDPSDRARIRKEVDPHIRYNEPGGYDLIVISEVSEKNKDCIGKNLEQIAEMWKVEPVDAYLRLLEEEEGSVGYVGHGMSPENVKMVLSHPLVMISSDGYSIAPTGKVAQTKPHPRSYGTYPRALGYYVREEKIFDLPVAIKKMTSMPADQSGITDRGRLAPGKKADIVAFDPATVKDVATYEDPHQYPVGITHVVVNGVLVVSGGSHTGATPGRILRKS
jgi:N-acyl-D-aspartate/D-glutamate deacylase